MKRKPAQQGVLDEFWSRAEGCQDIVDRLMLLQEFADRKVRRKSGNGYIKIRAAHRKQRRGVHVCWACRKPRADVRHHIIQVQYGGTNRPENQVPLCHGCHAVVHPWLRDDHVPTVALTPQQDRHAAIAAYRALIRAGGVVSQPVNRAPRLVKPSSLR